MFEVCSSLYAWLTGITVSWLAQGPCGGRAYHRHGDGATGMVLGSYKNNVLLAHLSFPLPPPRRFFFGGGGLTGGPQNVALPNGIRCDKSVSQRCLWATLSPDDDPSDMGVSVRTPQYNKDSGVLTFEYTDDSGGDSGVSVLTFEYSDDSRDRSRDNVLTFEYMDDT